MTYAGVYMYVDPGRWLGGRDNIRLHTRVLLYLLTPIGRKNREFILSVFTDYELTY